MPPRLENYRQQRNISPRNDMSLFYCGICKEGFTHHNEIEAHRSSKDHLHCKQLKEMRTEARELAATKPDEPLLAVHYAERDEWSEMWPQRLLFVPEMKSYERGDGNRYGTVCEPRYNILSYTWGRWQDATGQVQSLEVEGIEWKIPAIQPHIFTADEFRAIIHEVSLDVEWVWVDVACIDQNSSDILSTKARDEEVGRQAGIFARASSAFVWLHQSPIEKLQRFADELFGLSARCSGDDKHTLDTEMGGLDVHFGVDYEDGIFPSCVLDLSWLERVGQILSILEDEPWFSSLWTLQESLLQPMATVLSREGQQLSRQGYLEVGLANFLASWGDIENALERSADIITTSSEEHRTAVADILTRMEALGLKSHDNPVLVYSIAGYRKTLHEEDRIYGIMQLFGLKLGKSSNPRLSFSLSELEVQFAAAINKKSPVWAQLFVHGMNQSAGRHWCINQSCRLPQCVNIVSGLAKSQCHISVDANGQASSKGSCCSFEQLQAAWDSTRKVLSFETYGRPRQVQVDFLLESFSLTRMLSSCRLFQKTCIELKTNWTSDIASWGHFW